MAKLFLQRIMIDVRTTRGGAVASEGITREMQVAGTRKADIDGAITMDIDIAGPGRIAFAMVASQAVSVSEDSFLDVAGT